MQLETLSGQISAKRSFLCVGLDIIPASFEHNKRIIDATAPYAVAYKPNTAFYESMGAPGWACLEQTVAYLRTQYPHHFVIADAKRGDIGHTAEQYAKAFFERMDFDAVTIAPYMGFDSVAPFLAYKDKFVILLALTSNHSADDFETLPLEGGEYLFERVLRTANSWAGPDKIMYVVGATRADRLKQIRALAPNHFLLVPGVGAQGGDLDQVVSAAQTPQGGLLINVSRGITQAPEGPQAAAAAYAAAFAKYL